MELLIGDILLQNGVITEEQLLTARSAKDETGETLDEVLLRQGAVKEKQLLDILSDALGTRWVHIPERIDPQVTSLVPAEFAFRHVVLPVSRENGVLTVATLDPTQLHVSDDLKMLTGLDVEMVLAPRKEILENVETYFGTTVEKMIADLSVGGDSSKMAEVTEVTDLRDLAREPTVINLVNLIIFQAVQERASDIHIEPFENTLKVRYRIDGMLREMPPPPKHLQAAVISRVKIMAEMDIAERFTPQDGHIRLRMGDRELDLRVSTVPTVFGESVVMRILDKTSILLGVNELGLFEETERKFTRLLHRSHGIILVTGPTGSGKTTTLYAALNYIKSPALKIITIEEPVEYNLEGINQIQVNPKRGLTFANGLRSIVRQDPDVIMVGEIRDPETAEISIRSALTGHLVFSTLHTNNAAGAITRLLDMGVDAYLLSSSISGVLAQRLVRVVCPNCREPYRPQEEMLAICGITDPEKYSFMHGAGCEECHGAGYRGRSGLFELLVLTDDIRDLILTRPSTNQIANAAHAMSLREYGLEKVRHGVTTLEEVVRVTVDDEI
ncbi:MAG TPA: ATPase, T2SS/T4P/T4SS family [bacterium]|nr:ATPase, T2SS/T4P/T4SS family [bacterium]HQP99025.1 ATPase, T2SS/T4P/T4SS family [bacterium]